MNAKHTRAVSAAYSDLEGVKARLEECQSALQESIDAKSDKWREGEAGEAAQEELDNIGEAITEIESAMERLDNVTANHG